MSQRQGPEERRALLTARDRPSMNLDRRIQRIRSCLTPGPALLNWVKQEISFGPLLAGHVSLLLRTKCFAVFRTIRGIQSASSACSSCCAAAVLSGCHASTWCLASHPLGVFISLDFNTCCSLIRLLVMADTAELILSVLSHCAHLRANLVS